MESFASLSMTHGTNDCAFPVSTDADCHWAHIDSVKVIGFIPASANEKGDRRVRKLREHAPHQQSSWHYEPDESTIQGDDVTGLGALRALVADIRHLSAGLGTLRPEYLTVIRWSGEISVQGNFEIEAALLAELGALGCDLYATAYREDDEGVGR